MTEEPKPRSQRSESAGGPAVLALVALIQLIGILVRDAVLAAVLTIAICGAVIARWIWAGWYKR